MANLFLDRAGAEGVVSNVKGFISELEDTAAKINDAILGDMPNYWQGIAHDKMESTYEEQYREFLMNKVPEMVEELRKYMDTCVQEIFNVDQQLAGK